MLRKKRLSIITRLMKLSDFPVEASGYFPTVEIKGDCEVCVLGCEKILEFEDNRIIIKAKRQTIEIIGSDLEISEFLATGVCATGTVNEVKLMRE